MERNIRWHNTQKWFGIGKMHHTANHEPNCYKYSSRYFPMVLLRVGFLMIGELKIQIILKCAFQNSNKLFNKNAKSAAIFYFESLVIT